MLFRPIQIPMDSPQSMHHRSVLHSELRRLTRSGGRFHAVVLDALPKQASRCAGTQDRRMLSRDAQPITTLCSHCRHYAIQSLFSLRQSFTSFGDNLNTRPSFLPTRQCFLGAKEALGNCYTPQTTRTPSSMMFSLETRYKMFCKMVSVKFVLRKADLQSPRRTVLVPALTQCFKLAATAGSLSSILEH